MEEKKAGTNFIRQIVADDLKTNKWDGRVVTRFPPEPNGFLHIGHAKSICLNFGIAEEYKDAICHLRFDDTNPDKEDEVYIKAIKEDVKWLGFDWGDRLHHSSDYFDQLFEFAVELIKKGKAFVCDLTADEMKQYRGSLTKPGKESPNRNRTVEENLELFKRMKNGDFAEGEKSLRAKIDMSSPNMNMRDPVIYRIKKASHPMTGDKWCLYPMYDYTHCLSDSLESITHSLCTLEFEDHRPLYDWVLNELEVYHPQQIEFAMLNLEYTVLSKRKLLQLVKKSLVNGWNDPRMPTISGMRRRGYTPESIRNFCDQIGVTKKDSTIEIATLETCVRDHLNEVCPRAYAVLRPLKVVITNWDQDKVQEIEVKNHPFNDFYGTRMVPLTREIYIERDDFMEVPPKKYFRLKPFGQVRLRFGYVITCEDVVKNEDGEVVELKCSYREDTFGGVTPEGMKKVKGIINWVSASDCLSAEVRLYDRLFKIENPLADKTKDFLDHINPQSIIVLSDAKIERNLKNCKAGSRYQFERQGYFIVDDIDSQAGIPIFNRTITLRDTWANKK